MEVPRYLAHFITIKIELTQTDITRPFSFREYQLNVNCRQCYTIPNTIRQLEYSSVLYHNPQSLCTIFQIQTKYLEAKQEIETCSHLEN